jgi:HD superfamily phosphodiesterase
VLASDAASPGLRVRDALPLFRRGSRVLHRCLALMFGPQHNLFRILLTLEVILCLQENVLRAERLLMSTRETVSIQSDCSNQSGVSCR